MRDEVECPVASQREEEQGESAICSAEVGQKERRRRPGRDEPFLLERSDVVRCENFDADEGELVHEVLHVRTARSAHASLAHRVRQLRVVHPVQSAEDRTELATDRGQERRGVAGEDGVGLLSDRRESTDGGGRDGVRPKWRR